MADALRVGVAGLGSIGMRVARALDQGMDGLRLSAVAASSPERAAERVVEFRSPPQAVALSELPFLADVVVECLPPAAFETLVAPVIAARTGTLLVASVGRLLTLPDVVAQLEDAGVRIAVPSGAIAGIDGLRAAREIGIETVQLTTRKNPRSFGDTLDVDGAQVETAKIGQPVRLFSGNASDAVRAFPKNVNGAATVALAGVGAEATRIELWADPSVTDNTHELVVRSLGGEMRAISTNYPDESNPKSSAITAYSIIAALRRFSSSPSIGS